MKRSFALIVFGALSMAALSGCSFDASVTEELSVPPVEYPYNRKDPDFVIGEEVITDNGYRLRGAMGEISEKKTLANGYQFEGAFYRDE